MPERYTVDNHFRPEMWAGYVVREVHPDGKTAQIQCYCITESSAQRIADALNFFDAHPPIHPETEEIRVWKEALKEAFRDNKMYELWRFKEEPCTSTEQPTDTKTEA